MPLYLKIVDEHGNPDATETLADVIVDAVSAKGIGLLRTQSHVANDLRAAIRELLKSSALVVQQPLLTQICHDCKLDTSVWHTYQDGTILCTLCKSK